MALAVTDFEALCGFCSHSDLEQALRSTPELQACIGQDVAAQVLSNGHSQASRRAALIRSFTQLMTADPQVVTEQVSTSRKNLGMLARCAPQPLQDTCCFSSTLMVSLGQSSSQKQ